MGKEVCWIEFSSAPTMDDSPKFMVELEEKTSPSKQLLLNGTHDGKNHDVCKFDVKLSFFLFELFHFGWKLKCLHFKSRLVACVWYLGRIHPLFRISACFPGDVAR